MPFNMIVDKKSVQQAVKESIQVQIDTFHKAGYLSLNKLVIYLLHVIHEMP